MHKLLKKGLLLIGILFFGGVLLHTRAQQTTGELKLEITAGQSCCIYGTSVVFGEKDVSFGITEFSGDFLSYHGTTSWGCKDLLGTETGWAMYIAMSGDMENENGNKIGSGNVKISFDETTLVGGNCIPYNNSGTDISLNTSVTLLEKDGNISTNYGKICELGTTNVQLKVVTNTGQAPGNYVGTLVIDLPSFASSNCDELIGIFYDAETDGLNYEGDQGSMGITSNGGSFSYKPGEQITFKVGTVTLGDPVTPATNGSVFVTDLFGLARTEITDANVIKVGKLLQGLDDDNNPNNGISISGAIATSFTENSNISSLDVDAKLTALSKPIRTSKEVVLHLEDTATNKLNENCKINYSWVQTNSWSGTEEEFLLIREEGPPAGDEGWFGLSNTRGSVVDSSGNIYVVGEFLYPVSFGSTLLTSSGNYDVYIAKLNSKGEWQWGTKLGGTVADYVGGIEIDDLGNIYVVGNFQDTVTFGSTTLISSGNSDVYVSKLNNAGDFQWTVKGGGLSSSRGRGISVSQNGNIYIIGDFYQTVTFSGTSLVSDGSDDTYVAKLDQNGNWQRAVRGGGYSNEHGNGIALDNSENIYIIGEFNSTNNLDFGSTVFVSSGFYDIYVAKLDSNGNWQRAVKGGGTGNDEGYKITLDSLGNIYIAGHIRYKTNFGSIVLTGDSFGDAMAAKLDSNGNWQRAVKGGGTTQDYGKGIAIDGSGNICLVGYFNGTTASFGSFSLESEGTAANGFLGKLDQNGNWIHSEVLEGVEEPSLYLDNINNIYIIGEFNADIGYSDRIYSPFGNKKSIIYKITPWDNDNKLYYETTPAFPDS